MKKAVGVFFACVVGAFVALQADRWLAARQDRQPILAPSATRGVIPVEAAGGGTPPSFRDAAKLILPSVVSIDAVSVSEDFWGNQRASGDSGSGVVISEQGHIITNNHVIQTEGRLENLTVHLSDGRTYPARVLGADPRSDLAVLKIDAPRLVPARLGKSSTLSVGDWVLAIGNPLRQDNSVSAGIVANLGRDIQLPNSDWLIDAIQTDASINPGNSGGALTNAQGELVGINTAILSPTRSSIGIGFAIPIDRARPIVDELIAEGRIAYGEAGIELTSRTNIFQYPGVRERYIQITGAEPPADGVLITEVKPGGPAARAGIRALDVLMRVNDENVNTVDDYTRKMSGLRPGQKIKVTYFSRGQMQTKEIVLIELR